MNAPIPWHAIRVGPMFRGALTDYHNFVLAVHINDQSFFPGFHHDQVPTLAQDIERVGWIVTKTLMVMVTEDPNAYVIIDGVHRWSAVRFITHNIRSLYMNITYSSLLSFFRLLYEQGKIAYDYTVPCCILTRETPRDVLICQGISTKQYCLDITV